MTRRTAPRPLARPTVPLTLFITEPHGDADGQRRRYQLMARPGDTILELALRHGIAIEHQCGGICNCTTCHVHVSEGPEHLSTPAEDECHRLHRATAPGPTSRLACQATVIGEGPVTIIVPEEP